jgi:hypothetical protein
MRSPKNGILRYKSLDENDLLPDELVFAAAGASESRGKLDVWREISSVRPSRVVWLSPSGEGNVRATANGDDHILSLRDAANLAKLIASDKLLIDISGLPHQIWAPLVKVANESGVALRVMYVEPESYKQHPSPASASTFDLSVEFGGLAPLPGFARLLAPADEDKCIFVALLGFEGSRPERLILELDPTPKVIPVVGVPGFQIEYPAFTVGCNRLFLDDYRAQSELRFAMASCPFELYKTLSDITVDYPDHYLYIAVVGTKPHALGAIKFAIDNPGRTEIMFDHPIRKEGRTKGVGLIHIYDMGLINAY